MSRAIDTHQNIYNSMEDRLDKAVGQKIAVKMN